MLPCCHRCEWRVLGFAGIGWAVLWWRLPSVAVDEAVGRVGYSLLGRSRQPNQRKVNGQTKQINGLDDGDHRRAVAAARLNRWHRFWSMDRSMDRVWRYGRLFFILLFAFFGPTWWLPSHGCGRRARAPLLFCFFSVLFLSLSYYCLMAAFVVVGRFCLFTFSFSTGADRTKNRPRLRKRKREREREREAFRNKRWREENVFRNKQKQKQKMKRKKRKSVDHSDSALEGQRQRRPLISKWPLVSRVSIHVFSIFIGFYGLVRVFDSMFLFCRVSLAVVRAAFLLGLWPAPTRF